MVIIDDFLQYLENAQYLENLKVEKRKVLLSRIIERMEVKYIGEKRYSAATLVQEYYVLLQYT